MRLTINCMATDLPTYLGETAKDGYRICRLMNPHGQGVGNAKSKSTKTAKSCVTRVSSGVALIFTLRTTDPEYA